MAASFNFLYEKIVLIAMSLHFHFQKPIINDLLNLPEGDRAAERLKQADHEYRPFVEGNMILKTGLLEKKRHAHYPTRR